MFFDGSRWLPSVSLGGTTDFAPSVTYNPASNRLFVVHTGMDRQVYYSSSVFGSNPNGTWFSLGGRLDGRPSIAAMANGNMQVGGIASGAPWYMELNSGGGQIIPNWVRDSSDTASLTLAALTLVAVANTVAVYIRNPGDFVYGKTAWRSRPWWDSCGKGVRGALLAGPAAEPPLAAPGLSTAAQGW